MSSTVTQNAHREITHAEESHARAKHASQINTRINTTLKEQGEAGFAAAGLTSSEAIRMLYEFSAARILQPESIKQALSLNEAPSDSSALRRQKLDALRRGPQIVSSHLASRGVSRINSDIASLPCKRLEEIAYAEKYGIEM